MSAGEHVTLLTSSEVIKRLEGRITYRQLDYWVRIGRVTPSLSDTNGTGNYRIWSAADVTALSKILDVLDQHARDLAELQSGAMWADFHHQ